MPETASSEVPLPSRLATGDFARRAVRAAGDSAARYAGAPEQEPDPERVAVAYSSERHLRIGGEQPQAFAPLSGFFETADGWVRTHGNYPHHAEALIRALGLQRGAGRDAVAGRLRSMHAADAEGASTRSGGLCVEVRSESPERDAALRAASLVRTARIGQASPASAGDPDASAPLRGIRVLDLTRVIAGPVCTRTLALLGADVLRIDSPALPEIAAQHLDTGHGKRSALLDLRASADRQVFDVLLETADVVVLGYRSAALDALGLAPASLAARRPGVVVARLTAWGDPDRRGFDSLVQAASGIALVESVDGATPGALPAQALDHSAGYLLAAAVIELLARRRTEGGSWLAAGYLLAAAVIELLARRRTEGGSWLAETSLRRMAAELLGMPRTADPSVHAPFDPVSHLQRFDVAGTEVVTAAPAITYAGGPVGFAPPRPWGGDQPAWLPR